MQGDSYGLSVGLGALQGLACVITLGLLMCDHTGASHQVLVPPDSMRLSPSVSDARRGWGGGETWRWKVSII